MVTFEWPSTGFLLIFNVMSAIRTEWIDLPQFSDVTKVYRFPSNFRKFPRDDHQKVFTSNPYQRTITVGPNFTTESSDTATAEILTTAYSTNKAPVFRNIETNAGESMLEESKEDDASVEIEEETLESLADELNDATENLGIISSASSCPAEFKNNQYCDYLPVNLLRQVHKTLTSQPATLRGKMHFLKAFEKNLLSEIESRLTAALAPLKKTRRVRDSHGHDKEESIGFPSVEGALMTISFLTFAVYLVRLVMQLFRKVQNNTTQAPTIFLGRRKRSINAFTENTAEILRFINEPAGSQKHDEYGFFR